MAAVPEPTNNKPSSILLKGGKVVNPDDEGMMDVLIVGDKIERVQVGIDPESCPAGTRVIDCKGKMVMPGGIDPHTHCQLPFMGQVAVDDFYYGTRAAVAGGTTMIIDFAIPTKGESLVATWHKWRSWADPKVNCDYGLHIACTWWDKEGTVAKEMETLVNEHGVTTFKCFMAYKNVFMISDEEMFEVFKQCKKIGAMAQVHAENGDAIADGSAKMIEKGITGPEGHCMSRPEDVEGEATYRALMIGDRVNTPVYIVHVMSKSACDAVVRARKEGKLAFGEPIAAGLGTDGHNCWHHNWRHAAGYVMGPPLRPCSDTKLYLMKHLATGDMQTVGTDNCLSENMQVLTLEHGWVSHAEAKALFDKGELTVAGYDIDTGCIKYNKPTRFIEKSAQELSYSADGRAKHDDDRMMNFSHKSSRNGLQITQGHSVLVVDDTNDKVAKVRAGELAGLTEVALLETAKNGVAPSEEWNDKKPAESFAKLLPLSVKNNIAQLIPALQNVKSSPTDEALLIRTFLQVFGFWLGGNGSMTADSVQFGQRKLADVVFIERGLKLLGLVETNSNSNAGESLSSTDLIAGGDYYRQTIAANKITTFRIFNASWCEVFAEFRKTYLRERNEEGEGWTIKSVKWVPTWVFKLAPVLVGDFLTGLSLAGGDSSLSEDHDDSDDSTASEQQNKFIIHTSGARFRDQLIQLALHAGLTATSSSVMNSVDNNMCSSYKVSISVAAQSAKNVFFQDGITFAGESYTQGIWCVEHPTTNIVVRQVLATKTDDRTEGEKFNVITEFTRPTIISNCTFNGDQKALGKDDFRKIPNGVNGLQDRLSVVWNNGVAGGILTPCRFVQVCSTNVAKLFGCYPRKGILRPGSDADVVVWNPDTIREVSAKTHMHACDFNIFEGMKLKGVADITISRGRVVWENGKFDESNRGKGEYIYRKNFGYPFESTKYREEARDAYEQPVKREPYTGPIAGSPQ